MTFANLNFGPPPRVLRQFAATWLLVFVALGTWHGLHQARPLTGIILAGTGLAVGALGLWRPTAVRGVYGAALVVTFPLGRLSACAVLAAIYYGAFTPVALAVRLFGRDALRLRHRPDASTYWQPRPQPADVASYFRQF